MHPFPGVCAQCGALLSVFPFPLLSIPVRGVGVGLLRRFPRCPPQLFAPCWARARGRPGSTRSELLLCPTCEPCGCPRAGFTAWCPLQKVLLRACCRGCGRSSLGGLHGAASSAWGASSARGAPAASSSEGCSEISPPGDPGTAGWDGRSCVQAQEVSHPLCFSLQDTPARSCSSPARRGERGAKSQHQEPAPAAGQEPGARQHHERHGQRHG